LGTEYTKNAFKSGNLFIRYLRNIILVYFGTDGTPSPIRQKILPSLLGVTSYVVYSKTR
jgi:hypothetical protein